MQIVKRSLVKWYLAFCNEKKNDQVYPVFRLQNPIEMKYLKSKIFELNVKFFHFCYTLGAFDES